MKILSTRGEWVYAALPNNLNGWIPAASMSRSVSVSSGSFERLKICDD